MGVSKIYKSYKSGGKWFSFFRAFVVKRIEFIFHFYFVRTRHVLSANETILPFDADPEKLLKHSRMVLFEFTF